MLTNVISLFGNFQLTQLSFLFQKFIYGQLSQLPQSEYVQKLLTEAAPDLNLSHPLTHKSWLKLVAP